MFTFGGNRNAPTLIQFVHFFRTFTCNGPKSWRYLHFNPVTYFSIEKSPIGNMYGIHLLKTHRLSNQLHLIHIILFGLAVLILYRNRNPIPMIFWMSYHISHIIRRHKLYHITNTIKPKPF